MVAALENCFHLFGVPDAIQVDNGKEFTNHQLKTLCGKMHIQIIHGRPRNPKAQGMVERVNQTVKRGLARTLFVQDSHRWIDHLEAIVYNYNCAVHRATGKSPFFLFFGKNGYNAYQTLPIVDESDNPEGPDEEKSS